jgi:hypothetical protein
MVRAEIIRSEEIENARSCGSIFKVRFIPFSGSIVNGTRQRPPNPSAYPCSGYGGRHTIVIGCFNAFLQVSFL